MASSLEWRAVLNEYITCLVVVVVFDAFPSHIQKGKRRVSTFSDTDTNVVVLDRSHRAASILQRRGHKRYALWTADRTNCQCDVLSRIKSFVQDSNSHS